MIELLLGASNRLLHGARRLLWPRRPRKSPERICVYRIGNVGDTVCAIPALWAIRQTWPSARLMILTSPGTLTLPGAREVLGGEDWIDDIVVYAPSDMKRPRLIWMLIKDLQSQQIDLWIELPIVNATFGRLLRDMLFARFAGARYGIGWWQSRVRLWRPLQSEKMTHPNEVQRLLGILRDEGIVARDSVPKIWSGQEETQEAERLLAAARATGRPLVAVAPGAKRPTNRWFIDRWAEIIRYLDQQGMHPILLGGKAEVALCKEVAQQAGCQMTNLTGLTTIRQAGAIFHYCGAIICVDSGLQHIAALAGAKCVTLMAARDIRGGWHPEGRHIVLEQRVPCHTCFLEVCPHDNLCMREISVDDVKEGVRNLLAGLRAGSC
ncbi:MAG: glycosyltransferase family 9 protein [Nitrospira sp.]|nr:glycosyltransferase family 9 protein [Nitrospira sp.]